MSSRPGPGRCGDSDHSPDRAHPSGRLDRGFFARPSPEVARDLLGVLLARPDDGLLARLVEVEAYLQSEPACHAFRGRTAANATLFGPPGHLYVYFTYGMHFCANVATGAEGHGQGVLLRAAEPLAGWEVMRARRGERIGDRDLLRGPARLAQAFGLDRSWDGTDLCAPDAPLRLCADGWRPPAVEVGPRTGVAAAADLPYRFAVDGSRWVSPYKRHRRAGTVDGAGRRQA